MRGESTHAGAALEAALEAREHASMALDAALEARAAAEEATEEAWHWYTHGVTHEAQGVLSRGHASPPPWMPPGKGPDASPSSPSTAYRARRRHVERAVGAARGGQMSPDGGGGGSSSGDEYQRAYGDGADGSSAPNGGWVTYGGDMFNQLTRSPETWQKWRKRWTTVTEATSPASVKRSSRAPSLSPSKSQRSHPSSPSMREMRAHEGHVSRIRSAESPFKFGSDSPSVAKWKEEERRKRGPRAQMRHLAPLLNGDKYDDLEYFEEQEEQEEEKKNREAAEERKEYTNVNLIVVADGCVAKPRDEERHGDQSLEDDGNGDEEDRCDGFSSAHLSRQSEGERTTSAKRRLNLEVESTVSIPMQPVSPSPPASIRSMSSISLDKLEFMELIKVEEEEDGCALGNQSEDINVDQAVMKYQGMHQGRTGPNAAEATCSRLIELVKVDAEEDRCAVGKHSEDIDMDQAVMKYQGTHQGRTGLHAAKATQKAVREREEAAMKIQAVYRGRIGRREAAKVKTERLYERLHCASYSEGWKMENDSNEDPPRLLPNLNEDPEVKVEASEESEIEEEIEYEDDFEDCSRPPSALGSAPHTPRDSVERGRGFMAEAAAVNSRVVMFQDPMPSSFHRLESPRRTVSLATSASPVRTPVVAAAKDGKTHPSLVVVTGGNTGCSALHSSAEGVEESAMGKQVTPPSASTSLSSMELLDLPMGRSSSPSPRTASRLLADSGDINSLVHGMVLDAALECLKTDK